MSPLWRDEVGVYLSPHRLCLVRMGRGTRPQAVAEHELRFEPVWAASWEGPLAGFSAMLEQDPWRCARTRVVLADHWARYVIVPWVGELGSEAERLEHGRQLLQCAYGEAVAGWEVGISDGPPHVSRVACAMPAGLLAGVRAACTARGGRLLSLQPQLIDAYEVWRNCLPAAKSWFVSIERGSLAAARVGRDGWDRIHSVRIGADWMRELRRLQTFGRVACSRPDEGQVYVDAPHTWRAMATSFAAGRDMSGLKWLEELKTARTTLQRLGRARRLAA